MPGNRGPGFSVETVPHFSPNQLDKLWEGKGDYMHSFHHVHSSNLQVTPHSECGGFEAPSLPEKNKENYVSSSEIRCHITGFCWINSAK